MARVSKIMLVVGLAASAVVAEATICGPSAAHAASAASDPATRPATANRLTTIVGDAVAGALTVPGARVEIIGVEMPAANASSRSCNTEDPSTHAEVLRPVDGTGRVAVKLVGTPRTGSVAGTAGTASCEVWAWARVRVVASVAVARRALRAGDPLTGAVTFEERELRPGQMPLASVDGALAARFIAAGQVVEPSAVRAVGPQPGERIRITVLAGALKVEQSGQVLACGGGRGATSPTGSPAGSPTFACATLPSGRRVEGELIDGRLVVNVP